MDLLFLGTWRTPITQSGTSDVLSSSEEQT